jgi:NADPH:quinone reductase-like Zn-dependent oxidoreductase
LGKIDIGVTLEKLEKLEFLPVLISLKPSMQALVLQSTTVKDPSKYDPLVLSKVPIPTPKTGQVLVKIHACALNHRDLFIRQGLYPKIVTGSTLGSDCSGSVVTGTAKFPSGSPVILNPSVCPLSMLTY